ncbi:hypothetical protein HDV05_001322, partial [Chytridiales sp. JEL 0842]
MSASPTLSAASKPQAAKTAPGPSNLSASNTTPAGFKVRQRKRDIVTKNSPDGFRDSLLALIPEDCTDFDVYATAIESAAEKLEYKRYAEALFEFILLGGIL